MISIVVPAYNEEIYLERCLRSILFQNGDDYEVILVDDGSTDATGEIGRRWAENYPKLRYIYQSQAGQGTARDTGVDAAGGEWLVFVDADDELMPGALEIMRNHVNTGIDIVWYEHFLVTDEWERRQRIPVNEVIMSDGGSLRDVTTFLWDKMFRRSFWLKEAASLENCYGEDLITVYWLWARTKNILMVREALYRHYDIREMKHMSHQPERLMEITLSLAKMFDRFKRGDLWERNSYPLLLVCFRQYHLYKSALASRYSEEILYRICQKFEKLLNTYFSGELEKIKTLREKKIITLGGADHIYDLPALKIDYERYQDSEVFLLDNKVVYDTIFLINLSAEGRNVRCGTRTRSRFLEEWEDRCRELQAKIGGNENKIFVCRYKEDEREYIIAAQEVFLQYIPEAVVLKPEETALSMSDEGNDIHAGVVTRYRQNHTDSDGRAEAVPKLSMLKQFRGESYRHCYMEDMLLCWLKLQQRDQKISAYFEKRQISSIAIYGLGYLAERLAEELSDSSVRVLYGIDRSRTSSMEGLPVYTLEENLPETELIVVTVVHLYYDVEYRLGACTSIPFISLEEILYRCMEKEGE